MHHKAHKQMSEAFLTAAFLSISGGLQDAYTYLARGNVFANAQTGNIVLLSQHIANGDLASTIHYLIPLSFFAPVCCRISPRLLEPDCQFHGILLLRHAGTGIP